MKGVKNKNRSRMKRPKGAPSRSVNFLQKGRDALIRQAAADSGPLRQSVKAMAKDRYDRETKGLVARSNESLGGRVAEYLNEGARRPELASVPGYATVQETLGLNDPGAVNNVEVAAALGRLDRDQREKVARAIALQGNAGPLEMLTRARAGITGMLAEDGTRGDIARAGVVTAATGGSVMGLTAAGQGLMALMEYIQNGTQQQEQRESTLS